MNTPLSQEQRIRLYALAKTEARRLRRMAQDAWLDALWRGMQKSPARWVQAMYRCFAVLQAVRKQRP
jgi:hypothetical protein